MFLTNLWKIILVTAIVLSLVAFILGWIGFGVPDWHAFRRFNGTIEEFYGLWAYCQDQGSNVGTVCQRWPTAEKALFNGSRPSFIRTSEGLITTGMIMLSLGLFIGIVALALPMLAYLAAGLAFLAFLFLVIGLPIFGRQSNNFSNSRGDANHNKRYGFWLMVPTIILEFISIILFLLAGILYKLFGYGNIGTTIRNKPYGGRRFLGGPNVLNIPPTANLPYGMRPNMMYGPPGRMPMGGPNMMYGPPGRMPMAGPNMIYGPPGAMLPDPYRTRSIIRRDIPTLLSQYISDHPTRFLSPLTTRRLSTMTLSPPPVVRTIVAEPVLSVAPSNLRIGEPVGPQFQPIINLTGQTLIGPLVRTA